MERTAALALTESDPKKLERIQNWKWVDNQITKFGNNCRQSTFEFLFDKEEGKRLWLLYVIDYGRDFCELINCLTDEQWNLLITNICYNELLLAK